MQLCIIVLLKVYSLSLVDGRKVIFCKQRPVVDLWLKFCESNGELLLGEVSGGDFAIAWEELNEFRNKFSIIELSCS